MKFIDNLDKLVHDMNKYIQYLNDISDQNYKSDCKYDHKTRTRYYAGDYNTGVKFHTIQVDVSKNDVIFNVDVRPTFDTSVKEEISIFFNHFHINDLDNIEHFEIKDGPWYRAFITINKDSLIKQAKQYFGDAIIPISKWKVYNIEDIGPLIAVGRWNGGRIAFKYTKKTNELVIKERGVNSPGAYTNKLEKNKRKITTGLCYKLHTSDDESYWLLEEDAQKYFSDGLPGQYVDHND